MDELNYVEFSTQHDTLKKITGASVDASGEVNTDSMSGIINKCNESINKELEYAESSTWAAGKIDEWNAIVPNLNTSIQNLAALLQEAKKAADAYHDFEMRHSGH